MQFIFALNVRNNYAAAADDEDAVWCRYVTTTSWNVTWSRPAYEPKTSKPSPSHNPSLRTVTEVVRQVKTTRHHQPSPLTRSLPRHSSWGYLLSVCQWVSACRRVCWAPVQWVCCLISLKCGLASSTLVSQGLPLWWALLDTSHKDCIAMDIQQAMELRQRSDQQHRLCHQPNHRC